MRQFLGPRPPNWNVLEKVLSDRVTKVFATVLYNTYERDWMELAQCQVTDPEDKSFIEQPTPDQDDRWGALCASCPVFMECKDWADREQITSTYIAGEWRE